MQIAAVLDYLKQLAPLELAADWDNVGLLLGDPAQPVERVLTCLTVTPESAAEAIAERVQLIVAHHPILFRGVKRLTASTAEGRMLLDLARAGIAVYSPHTAFDNCAGGINDLLAARLELTKVEPLRRQPGPGQCKIVVFVPDKDLDRVSDALFSAGAGIIGQYSQCSFRLEGKGTFFGSDAANPTIGQKGRREEVSEWRLEVVCPESLVQRAVRAMRQAHSYEEPAYDIYPLRPESKAGIGRVGTLAAPLEVAQFSQRVKTSLGAAAVQVVAGGKQVSRVALVCGAGGEFWHDALAQEADAFLTGEMRFHDALAARSAGLNVFLPGHHATERCGVEHLAELIKKTFPALEVWPSRRESDPLQCLS